MREVKFRAWKESEKRIIPWEELCADGEMLALALNRIYLADVMQYTGLKDRNGVEIYEGDAVYLAGYGDYVAEFPFHELYDAGAENDIGTIKGNIYENPELLES